MPYGALVHSHPGGNPGANLKSIPHRCYLFEVAFVWEFTKETIVLPLGCLPGRSRPRRNLLRSLWAGSPPPPEEIHPPSWTHRKRSPTCPGVSIQRCCPRQPSAEKWLARGFVPGRAIRPKYRNTGCNRPCHAFPVHHAPALATCQPLA